ncbi:MAG: hypothetical protein AAFP79_05090 [Pseudomonadota bacterium]
MSDWQVGDMALCVSVSHPLCPDAPRYFAVGQVQTVTRVGMAWWLDFPDEKPAVALGFNEVITDRFGFPPSLFLKVTPPADMVEEEREVEAPVIAKRISLTEADFKAIVENAASVVARAVAHQNRRPIIRGDRR